jgi:hypothetical protein
MSDALKLGLSTIWSGEIAIGETFYPNTLDASTEKSAGVFNLPWAITITHCGFWYSTRTGTPPTYRVSLQAVNASGNPDGTVLGGGSPASATFTPPADATWDTQWKWIALSNSYTAARGQVLAVVVDYSSGTIDASNRSILMGYATGCGDERLSFPNSQFYTAAAWTKSLGTPLCAIKDGASPTNVLGRLVETVATQSYDRSALKFNIPSTFCSTYKIRGAKIRMLVASGTTFKLGLWSAAGVLQDVTVDSDTVKPGSQGAAEIYFDEVTLSTLSAGTYYYIGIEQVSGTGSLACQVYDAEIAQQLAMPFGTSCMFSSYTGAAWTDDATKVPIVVLLFEDVTPPTGGAGMIVHPGMDGGMRA